jgi:glycosyltransferase involved in cell wall biosynthesis
MAESCDRIVRSLRELGTEVDVLHFNRSRTDWEVRTQSGGRYLSCLLEDDPAHTMSRAWSVLAADAELRARATHVVAFGGQLPLVAGPLYAAWLGLPLVTLFRGNDFDTGVFSPRRADVVRESIARASAVGCVSRDKVDRIAPLHPGVPLFWTPNGIDLERWAPAASDHARARELRESEVPPGRLDLGLIGELKRKKGGLLLLEALIASGRADEFHLLFAGWLEAELEAWLAEHGTRLSYTLAPFSDRYEMLSRYLACDFVALPSFYDGMPNVMLEAAALGVPLVASRTGGMADFLSDPETALMFAPGDRQGCAEALARAADLEDRERAAMGAACRALAEAEFDHRDEARRYEEILRASGVPESRAPAAPAASRPG